MRYYRYRPNKLKIRNRVISLAGAAAIGATGIAVVSSISNAGGSETKTDIAPTETVSLNPTTVNNGEEVVLEQKSFYEETGLDEEIVEEYLQLAMADYAPVTTEVPVVPTAEPVIPTAEPVIPTAEPVARNTGDTIIANKQVNMRLDNNSSSFRLGGLSQGDIANRIMNINGWDLINYNGTIAFVSGEFTSTYEYDYNNEYYDVEEYSDIVRTTSVLNFRLGPSTNEQSLFQLENNEEAVVIGKATLRDNPSDVWYIVRARGQIGFISAKYTTSLREKIMKMNPDITDVKIKKFGYLKTDTAIYDENNNAKFYADQYQLVQVIQEFGNMYLVDIDGEYGYVSKKSVKEIRGSFIAVDISTQRLYYYIDDDVVFRSKCTTGRDGHETDLGFVIPYGNATEHDFGHGYKASILWRPWSDEGFHDINEDVEPESKFGDVEYRKRHGSSGCIRLPKSTAWYFRENIPYKTPVLIKK